MKKTQILLFTGLILGLGWAIRGHFGHEWGAAWAGSMGGLAIILASRRQDWWNHAPVLALLSAIGWGVGGMMSYGIVIGYCRGIDFGNVAYGYAMLAVIGGLYGCIGGGMLGLGLASHPEKRPQWAALIAEMVAGAWLSWGLLIYQMEWFMTPPRSELWAACLGAAAALLWYLYRNGFFNAARVALFAALGAGFGFSFGNFIQTLGSSSGLAYNWWNVMEFTLGLCGGIGMAYAILTATWPDKGKTSGPGNIAALLALFFVIPLTNFDAAFSSEKLGKLAERLAISAVEPFVSTQQTWGWIAMLLFTGLAFVCWRIPILSKIPSPKWAVSGLLFSLSLYYLFFSFLVKGIFYEAMSLGNSVMAYLPILLLTYFLWISGKEDVNPFPESDTRESWQQGLVIVCVLLVLIALISFISIHAHDGLGKYHERF